MKPHFAALAFEHIIIVYAQQKMMLCICKLLWISYTECVIPATQCAALSGQTVACMNIER